MAAYTACKAFGRVFSEALWLECQPLGVDVLHLNIGFTAIPAMERLSLPIEYAETPEMVAREGLDNIAIGPVWIISTPGNAASARRQSVIDNWAEVVRTNAPPSREDTCAPQVE